MTESMSFALPFTALAASQETLALGWLAAGEVGVAALAAACVALLFRRRRR